MASGTTDKLAFEVLRFRAAPALEVGVLELDGRFSAGASRSLGRPRLRVETADGASFDAAALTDDDARAEPNGARWHATFAVPLSALGDASFALAVGRSLLLDLPGPDLEDADAADIAHRVRLARDANSLRRALEHADGARATAEERAGRAERELESAQAELARLQQEREELARDRAELLADRGRVGEKADARAAEAQRRLEEERVATERRIEAIRAQESAAGAEQVEAAVREADAARDRALEEERARTAAARRELKQARAELEALRRAAPAREPEPSPPPVAAVPAEPSPSSEDPTTVADPDGQLETVRVLSDRRRPRSTDTLRQTRPTPVAPDVAEIGARHITPGTYGPAGSWRARVLALGALALVIAVVVIAVLVALHG